MTLASYKLFLISIEFLDTENVEIDTKFVLMEKLVTEIGYWYSIPLILAVIGGHFEYAN